MTEPHAPVDLEQPGRGRGLRRAGIDAEAFGGTPDERRVADGLGRGGQQQPPGVDGKATRAAAGSPVRCGSPSAWRRPSRSRRRAPPGSSRGVAPAAPAGCRASRRRCGCVPAPRAGRGSRTRAASARRHRSGRAPSCPAARQLARPRRPRGWRRRTATDSAIRRRATNASACADARSSHCASSTTHSNGRSRAASARRPSTARPTKKRSGGSPALRPNAVLSASRCGPGSASSRSSIGAHSCCSPAYASSISASDARRARDTAAGCPVRQVFQQGGLADPGLATQHEHGASAGAQARHELIQRLALATPPEQSATRITVCHQRPEPRRSTMCATHRVGSAHERFTDNRSRGRMRPAAVAASSRRPAPAAERVGRRHGAGRGRGRVPRGRDHQRRRRRRAGL